MNGPEIHPGKWQRVGRDLNEKLKAEGQNAVPDTVFSYWGLIRDIVEGADKDCSKRQLLSVAEFCLQPLSRPASAASLISSPSVVIEMGDDEADASSMDKLPPPAKPLRKPYPALKTLKNSSPKEDSNSPKVSLNYPVFFKTKRKQKEGPLDRGDKALIEEEAAKYHNPGCPPSLNSKLPAPPYEPINPLQICGPTLIPTAPALMDEPYSSERKRLAHQLTEAKEVLKLQQELQTVSLRIRSLKKSKPSDALAFPVITRAMGQNKHQPDSCDFPPLPESDDDNAPREEESDSPDPEPSPSVQETFDNREHRKISFKALKEFHTAVKAYGPNAPFTLSALDSLSHGGLLLPKEWLQVTQAVLSRGQFLNWKADFSDRCHQLAELNQKNPRTVSWTFEKLAGQGLYSPEEKQTRFPAALLSQTRQAAMGAWRNLPSSGTAFTPLTKITQDTNEDFSEFVGRLLETAERTLGHSAAEDKIVKQLAYENANNACRAALRGKAKDKSLDEMIKICKEVDPTIHKMSQAMEVAVGAAFEKVLPFVSPTQPQNIMPSGPNVRRPLPIKNVQRICFRCGQLGHFAKQCPFQIISTGPNVMSVPQALPKVGISQVPSFCPRCRKGQHWAGSCHATHDVEGRPLQFQTGNGRRGLPRAPANNPPSFHSGPMMGHNPMAPAPSTGPLQEAQDWTCVPPPQQY